MRQFGQGRALRRVAALSALTALFCGTAQAGNTLTEAGRPVSNTFTLVYDVGTVTQPAITNKLATDPSFPAGGTIQGTPTAFTVDRKVDHIITATNSTLTTPPGTTVTLTYELENEGNDTQAYSFSIADLDNAAGTFDGTISSITYYIDTDDDGDFADETGVVITETTIGDDPDTATVDVTGDVPKGVKVLVEVATTIASGVADTETDDITLVAEARNPSAWAFETLAAGEEEEVTLATAGANNVTGAAQNVLADGTGVLAAETSGNADGIYAVTGIIEVQSPDLTATKAVAAIKEPGIADPFVALTDCATASAVANAKTIPGSCIEYLIEVTNSGATATAENLDIQDILPAGVTFVSASLTTSTTTGFADDPAVGGSGPTLATPAANTDCDGLVGTCNVQLTDAVLAAGEVGQIRIRALVD